jgi:hypothetical protein
MRKYSILIGLVALFMIWTASVSAAAGGKVYEDLNGNGRPDTGEPGVANVAVSDQVDVVLTRGDGSYELPAGGGYGLVFISVPDGYTVSGSFWKEAAASCDFGLKKSRPVTSFTFIHASDTHISPASLGRMKLFEKKADSIHPDMILITGDLVKDALRVGEKEASSLYELFRGEYPKLSAPTWLVPGNHEIFGIERHLSLVSPDNPLYGRKMYRHYFGPDYYSFNYGGVHFIGLNSLSFEDLWYYGHIDSLQLAWLARDLAKVPAQTPVVTFQHVPFYSAGLSIQPYEESGPARTIERENGVIQYRHVVSNTQDVLKLMRGHNYPLALGGHHHYQQRFSMAGLSTRFEQTAAVVGPASEGMLNMPSGIMVYKVVNGKIDAGSFVPLD